MSNLVAEIKQRIDNLQKEIEDIKKEIERNKLEEDQSRNDYALFLRCDESINALCVSFLVGGGLYDVALIGVEIENSFRLISDKYVKWMQKGFKVVNDSLGSIRFKGGIYDLNDKGILRRKDLMFGEKIFDFKRNMAIEGCEDDNLIRHPENKSVIIL